MNNGDTLRRTHEHTPTCSPGRHSRGGLYCSGLGLALAGLSSEKEKRNKSEQIVRKMCFDQEDDVEYFRPKLAALFPKRLSFPSARSPEASHFDLIDMLRLKDGLLGFVLYLKRQNLLYSFCFGYKMKILNGCLNGHKRRHELKRREIILKDGQETDRHSAKVIITLRENPFCLQKSYLIITHFFRVIP